MNNLLSNFEYNEFLSVTVWNFIYNSMFSSCMYCKYIYRNYYTDKCECCVHSRYNVDYSIYNISNFEYNELLSVTVWNFIKMIPMQENFYEIGIII